MGKIFRISLTLIVVAVAGIAGHWIWSHYLYSPWTRDGRVRAEIITIAPDVSGWVNQLNVKDNQVVNKVMYCSQWTIPATKPPLPN